MSRSRKLGVVATLMAVAVAYACDGNDGASGPTFGGDAGRDGPNFIQADSSAALDASSRKDSAAGPVRSVVAVGAAFACLLAKDRTVSCWGRNDVGQLGRDPATTPLCGAFRCSPTPTRVEGLVNVERLVAGDDFACALDQSGAVWCWGSNTKGQLSVAETAAMSFTPRKIIVGATDLDASGAHVCIIDGDGLVRCWGESTCEIFGKADGGIQVIARLLSLPATTRVSLGPDAMCIVTPLTKVLCWGADHRGSLGHDLDPGAGQCNGVPFDPIPKHVQSKATEVPIDTIVDVRMGTGVACARRSDGQVMCWGDNQRGALGQGFPDPTPHPRALDVPAIKAAQLEVHGQTPCAIVAQRLLCWGDGQYGQLDTLGGADAGCVPGQGQGCRALGYVIPGMMPVREVFSSATSIAAIKDDLSVWMWGQNSSAELALPQSDPANQSCVSGTSLCVPQPKQVVGVPPID